MMSSDIGTIGKLEGTPNWNNTSPQPCTLENPPAFTPASFWQARAIHRFLIFISGNLSKVGPQTRATKTSMVGADRMGLAHVWLYSVTVFHTHQINGHCQLMPQIRVWAGFGAKLLDGFLVGVERAACIPVFS